MKQKEYLFYTNAEQTYVSAKAIYEEVKRYLPKLNSILEFGCGMAAFARVFQENGVKDITIVDHPTLNVSNCLIREDFEFIPCDLDKELPPQQKVDLLVCTEVLEHINKKRAIEVLDFITKCSDVIIFSAGIPFQTGLGHINEQRHEYWINEFQHRGYDYCDAFKPTIIKNENIFIWLRQNIFIFFKNQPKESVLNDAKWIGKDFEIVNVHILKHQYTFKELIKILPKALLNSIFFRLKK